MRLRNLIGNVHDGWESLMLPTNVFLNIWITYYIIIFLPIESLVRIPVCQEMRKCLKLLAEGFRALNSIGQWPSRCFDFNVSEISTSQLQWSDVVCCNTHWAMSSKTGPDNMSTILAASLKVHLTF